MFARRAAPAAVALALLGTGAFTCDGADRAEAPRAAPTQTPTTAPARLRQPAYVTGVDLRGPTGLRLLASGWFIDVDGGPAAGAVRVSGWLPRPGHQPMLVEDRRMTDIGRVGVSVRSEPRLPGRPRVVVLTGSGLGGVAASADGAGVWIAEYLTRTRCSLREVGLDGEVRHPPRTVACGTRPVAETADGLWLAIGPDAFTAATIATGPEAEEAVLVDPTSRLVRHRAARADPIDARRAVVFPEPIVGAFALREAGGRMTTLTRPPAYGQQHPLVGQPSPDGT